MQARHSKYRNPNEDRAFLESWSQTIQVANGGRYERVVVGTDLGETVVWACSPGDNAGENVVLFHGARTCAMFLDIDNVLSDLKLRHRVFLVEINGQPTLSDGNSPDINSDGYGKWAAQVIEGLGLSGAIVGGASLGGLICMKLCLVAPQLVKKLILLNPAGITAFSLKPTNLFMNLLPIVLPCRATIGWFLDRVVFYRDRHVVSKESRNLLIDYELHALTQFQDASQKPATGMRRDELTAITKPVYLILGARDMLFPYQNSEAIARQQIPTLKVVHIIPDTGHGIETSANAAEIVERIVSAG